LVDSLEDDISAKLDINTDLNNNNDSNGLTPEQIAELEAGEALDDAYG